MRKIRFRAWSKIEKKMYNLELWQFKKEDVKIFAEVMQYIGLNDNTKFNDLTREEQIAFMRENKYSTAQEAKKHWKGKEIYEGDVLQGDVCTSPPSHYKKEIEVVEYDVDEGGYLPFVHTHDRCTYDICGGCKFPTNNIKIIGNIYENPELIKK